ASEALGNAREAVNEVVPELLAALRDDRDPTVRQRVAMALRHVREFEKSGAAGVLEKVLDEKGRDIDIVRYDSAPLLAFVLRDRAPARGVEVLVEMLNNPGLREYKGTDPTLNKGNESVKSGTGAEEKLGSDARYMAAQALGYIAAGGKRKDALDALKAA